MASSERAIRNRWGRCVQGVRAGLPTTLAGLSREVWWKRAGTFRLSLVLKHGDSSRKAETHPPASQSRLKIGAIMLPMMKCSGCGQDLADGVRFCTVCGKATAAPLAQPSYKAQTSTGKKLGVGRIVLYVVGGLVLIGFFQAMFKDITSPSITPKIQTITTDRVDSAGCSDLVYIKGTVKRIGKTFAPSLGLVGMNGQLFVLGDDTGEVTVELSYGSQLPSVGQKLTVFGNITCPPAPVAPNRFLQAASDGIRKN